MDSASTRALMGVVEVYITQDRDKVKGPELGISGPALRGVGGGRGLAARDAVCVGLILAVSDLVV